MNQRNYLCASLIALFLIPCTLFGSKEKLEKLTGVYGPMFSGKSTYVINMLQELRNSNPLAFKHAFDTRFGKPNDLTSHEGELSFPALAVKEPKNILNLFKEKNEKKKIGLVVIDEGQFFDSSIVDVVRTLAEKVPVFFLGLDLDFKREAFGSTLTLANIAGTVLPLKANCEKCGAKNEACYTQRLIKGEPAKINDPLIMVGGKEAYEPRCPKCYILLDENGKKIEFND